MEVNQFWCTTGSQTFSEGLEVSSCSAACLGGLDKSWLLGPCLMSARWPPQFLIAALKVVFAALSVQIWQCRVSATEIQLAALPAPTQLPWAPSAAKSLG